MGWQEDQEYARRQKLGKDADATAASTVRTSAAGLGSMERRAPAKPPEEETDETKMSPLQRAEYRNRKKSAITPGDAIKALAK